MSSPETLQEIVDAVGDPEARQQYSAPMWMWGLLSKANAYVAEVAGKAGNVMVMIHVMAMVEEFERRVVAQITPEQRLVDDPDHVVAYDMPVILMVPLHAGVFAVIRTEGIDCPYPIDPADESEPSLIWQTWIHIGKQMPPGMIKAIRRRTELDLETL